MTAGHTARTTRTDAVPAGDAAMDDLAVFAGTWHGSGWTLTRHGRAEFDQTELVEYRLGGELLTIEGTGSRPGAPSDVRFRAFAVVRIDPETGGYAWRAYSAGNSIEVPLERTDAGYRWGFDPGPGIRMRFDITIGDGAWNETGAVSTDDGLTWRRSLEMRLTRD